MFRTPASGLLYPPLAPVSVSGIWTDDGVNLGISGNLRLDAPYSYDSGKVYYGGKEVNKMYVRYIVIAKIGVDYFTYDFGHSALLAPLASTSPIISQDLFNDYGALFSIATWDGYDATALASVTYNSPQPSAAPWQGPVYTTFATKTVNYP